MAGDAFDYANAPRSRVSGSAAAEESVAAARSEAGSTPSELSRRRWRRSSSGSSSSGSRPSGSTASVDTVSSDVGARPDGRAETARSESGAPSPLGIHGATALESDELASLFARASERSAEQMRRGERVGAHDVFAIAAEVGISPDAVAAALAERQAGLPERRSRLDRIVGPATVGAERVIDGHRGESLQRIQEWLVQGHVMRSHTNAAGVVVATPRTDMSGRIRRRVRSSQGLSGLQHVRQLRAAAIEVEHHDNATASTSMVLAADVGHIRTWAMVGGGATTVAGSAAVMGVSMVAGPIVLAALPIMAGLGLVVTRVSYAPTLRTVQFAVEETADRIATGSEVPSPMAEMLNSVADRIRASLPKPKRT